MGCSALFVPQRDQPQPHPKQSHNLPTPINSDRLRNFLVGYTPSTVEFLYAGFTKGFPLHFGGEFLSFEAENLLSARDHPDVVFSKIKKETEALRLATIRLPLIGHEVEWTLLLRPLHAHGLFQLMQDV